MLKESDVKNILKSGGKADKCLEGVKLGVIPSGSILDYLVTDCRKKTAESVTVYDVSAWTKICYHIIEMNFTLRRGKKRRHNRSYGEAF